MNRQVCFLEQRIIQIPKSVSAGISKNEGLVELSLKGPLGETSLVLPDGVSVKENQITHEIVLGAELLKMKPLLGTFASLANQKIEGITQGFKKQLNLVGVGYRANIIEGVLNLKLGYSHEVNVEISDDLEILCPNQTTIFVKGVDLEKVTQKAAEIRSWRLPEPYKGKGIFYKNEKVRRKEGKKN